jgi:beta-1,4-mannosyl-glycoprotein beta-1,4-N-acetylglucosaminyltransferase
MGKVFDCFTFFNEVDLLEIRLNELNDVVDHFVIVEGTKTFQNKPKPSYYLENKERFKNFEHKIIRIEIPEEEFIGDPWANEQMSWNKVSQGLTDAQGNDIIIISALDEIPKKESIQQVIQDAIFPSCINTPMFYFYLNTQYLLKVGNNEWSSNWPGPYITPFNNFDLSNPYSFVQNRKNVRLVGDGWHYSFLGDGKNAKEKTSSYSHTELNVYTEEEYNQRRENLEDVFGRGDVKFGSIIENSYLPKYVQDNIKKYKKYLKK